MNRFLILIVITFTAFTINAKNNARADIFFVNGTVLENIELKCPRSWYDKVEYFIDGKKHKIHADSIDHMLLYHVDYPENKAYLRRNAIGKYDFAKNELIDWKAKNWQFLETAGEHLLYWVSFWKVKLGKKGFTFSVGAYEGTYTTPYYFKKPTDPIALNIPSNFYKPGATRDWLIQYLADDPEIVKCISEKGYFSKKQSDFLRHGSAANPFYYEDIAVDYNPQKPRAVTNQTKSSIR